MDDNLLNRPTLIDVKCSDFARVPIEVPQRSILGLVIFDLNVADLQEGFRCN